IFGRYKEEDKRFYLKMSEKDFEIGDLVWAKMKGYPFWPAKIQNPPNDTKSSTPKKPKHFVFFFGSKNCAWILDENIVPHSAEMLNNVSKKKSSSFVKAIDEIIEASGSVASKLKDVKEDSAKKDKSALKSTALQSPEKIAKIPSVKDNESSNKLPTVRIEKRGRKPKQKINEQKNENTNKKTPLKRSLQEDASNRLSPPVQKLCKKSDGYSDLIPFAYNPIAVFQPLDDLSVKPGKNSELVPGPSFVSSQVVTKSPGGFIPTEKKIGLIGLGNMGQTLVKKLLDSGHNVSVWNRTPEKCEQFAEAGVCVYTVLADIIFNCDIIFCCVSGPEAAKTIVFEKEGVLKGLEKCRPGTKGYVELTTIDPVTSQEIAEAITYGGGKYLEAPMSGSRARAEEGSLVILGAGDRDLFYSCESCFYAISKNTFYLSCEVGKGSQMNLILSMLVGTACGALAESIALIDQCDLPKDHFLEILRSFPLACDLFSEKGRAIIAGDFTADIPLKYQQKDMNLALTLGDKYEQPLALTSHANELYKFAKFLCYSEDDVAAVYFGANFNRRNSNAAVP
ncbi:putative oxidoreductase GLYR1 homolog, partial [Nephila pilipes]